MDGPDGDRPGTGERPTAGGGDAVDDTGDGAGSYVERALIETHHLANLTGLDEAERARRSLVNAQSAERVAKERDLLRQAAEYLELARIDRRDAASGFAEAQRLAMRAETALGEEGALLERPLTELFDGGPERPRQQRESLVELREQAAVGSFEQLRYDVLLDELFSTVRAEAGPEDEEPAGGAGGDVAVEEALTLADRELSDGDGGVAGADG